MVLPNHELVIARWKDANVDSGQFSLATIPHTPLIVETVGWLLRDDTDGISVAAEKVEDEWRGVTFILRELVLEVKPVIKKRKPHAKADPLYSAASVPNSSP